MAFWTNKRKEKKTMSYKVKLTGLVVSGARDMTRKEILENFGGDVGSNAKPTVIIFETGEKLFALCDPEGNGPGQMIIEQKNKQFLI